MSKQIRQYDKEFKDQAVRLYLSRDSSLPKLGQELGIPASTLAGTVKLFALE
jgi:transposase-like protein